MMPLTMVNSGEENEIKRVGGKEETRRFLENLGFVQEQKLLLCLKLEATLLLMLKNPESQLAKIWPIR